MHIPRQRSSGRSWKGPAAAITPSSRRACRNARCCSWRASTAASSSWGGSAGRISSTSVWASIWGSATSAVLVRVEPLGQHEGVAVQVVEGRQPDHALDLTSVPVEAHAVSLEMPACSRDVGHAERERGAALRGDRLLLADAEVDAGNRRPQLAPSPVGQGVDRFEAEQLLEPAAGALHVGDTNRRRHVAGVADRPGLLGGGCLIEAHGALPCSVAYRPVFILESLSCQTRRRHFPGCFTTAGRCPCWPSSAVAAATGS